MKIILQCLHKNPFRTMVPPAQVLLGQEKARKDQLLHSLPALAAPSKNPLRHSESAVSDDIQFKR